MCMMTTAALTDLPRFGPERCDTLGLAAAQRYTDRFLRRGVRGGENFTVASWLLPRSIRRGFADVYAFCRWADDLADDTRNRGKPERGLELLGWWRDELDRCYAGRPRHPVYVALAATVERHGLPRRPFDDLIDAFEQDQRVTRYADLPTLLRYCEKSANPVGRLVLMLMGYRDDERFALSDATCTALQLTNFWQDVRRDVLERDRVYLPDDVARRHGLDVETMVKLTRLDAAVGCDACTVGGAGAALAGVREMLPAYRATIRELVADARQRFDLGQPLRERVAPALRVDIDLFTRGGEAVLDRIERQRFDTWTKRPRLGKFTKARLLMAALASRAVSARSAPQAGAPGDE